jgi:hypothetical protein
MRAISTSTCSLASTFIGDELDSLQSAINVTNQKISQADQAITDNNALSQAIADFETAYNSGNTTTISSSANAYNLARQTALNSFSILIGSAQTGIANVYTAINSLLTNTVTEEGNYYSARGYGVYTGLSARLQSEKQALSKCQLSSGGSSSGGGI